MDKCSIVIYSQQTLLCALIESIIKDGHSQIICCHTLQHTINTCRRTNPSLVIILGTTPCINGETLIQTIRSSKSHHPAIYVIAWQHTEHTVLSLLECGIDQYFTFPLSMARIRLKIATHINAQ